jgi:predicted small secreted protein
MRLILALVLMSAALTSCATRRSASLGFAISDFSGSVRNAYYVGEALTAQFFWDVNFDPGKTAKCAVSNAMSGEAIWSGTAVIPRTASPGVQSPWTWSPSFPAEGLKPPVGAYILTCTFSDGGGGGAFSFSVAPHPGQ